MSKRKPYRIVRLVGLDLERLLEDVREQRLVLGIDVGKQRMVMSVMNECEAIVATLGWTHPEQTPAFLSAVESLRAGAAGVQVAMEPSGMYGDALRSQLLARGIEVSRVSPKRSSDAKEVYDGVPSSHDAKSAAIVAWLHLHGKSEPWPLKSEHERQLKAALQMLAVHSKQFAANRNRLEALMARHWPELPKLLTLGSPTFLELVKEFGGPAAVASRWTEALQLMVAASRGMLSDDKVAQVLASAETTMGMPQLDEEVELVQELAAETRRNQLAERRARRRVCELAASEITTARMQPLLGKSTAAVVVAATGSPLAYDSPGAFLKSLGLNLRERSSGEKQNRGLHLTKRGSSTARKYLYLAALRLLMADPVVHAWYLAKVKRDGGRSKVRAVVAVMRKMVAASWHVARGAPFDASKLFDTRRLAVVT